MARSDSLSKLGQEEKAMPRAGDSAGWDEARAAFLATTAHELRTPLTRLLLLSSSLARGLRANTLSHTDAVHRAEAITAHAKELMQIVAELVEAPTMAQGMLPLELEYADLSTLVRTCVERTLSKATKRAEVDLHLEPDVGGLWDAYRIDQIVSNLLSNALRFGGGQPIRVQVAAHGQCARIVVEDRGKGIDPTTMRRVNGDFDHGAHDGRGAVGLGLWLVDQVVRAIGGHLRVESVAGMGSTVTVEMPRRESDASQTSNSACAAK